MDEREKPTLKIRAADFARNALALADGLLLTQPRQILWGFDRYEDGSNRRLPLRDSLGRGAGNALGIVLFPSLVGVAALAVTRRPEVAAAATAVAYVAEGIVMDICEAMSFVQSSQYADALYGRWTYSLQRRLAEIANYPKAAAPYWL